MKRFIVWELSCTVILGVKNNLQRTHDCQYSWTLQTFLSMVHLLKGHLSEAVLDGVPKDGGGLQEPLRKQMGS